MENINDPIRGGDDPSMYPYEYERLAKTTDGTSKVDVAIFVPTGVAEELVHLDPNDVVSVDTSIMSSDQKIEMGSLLLPVMTLKFKETVNIPWELDGQMILWSEELWDDDEAYRENKGRYSGSVATMFLKGSPVREDGVLTYTAVTELDEIVDREYIPSADLSWPSTVGAVLDDIEDQWGVLVENGEMKEWTGINTDRIDTTQPITTKPKGLSYRTVIGGIAEYFGCNAIHDRTNSYIYFIWYDEVIDHGTKVIVSENICDNVTLTDTDSWYKGITYPVGDKIVNKGSKPRLALKNALGMMPTNFDASAIVAKLAKIKCRTGTVDMALGNALLDPWDVITLHRIKGHNHVICQNPGKIENGLTYTRRQDGAYILYGQASDILEINLRSNNIAPGTYILPSSIVCPSGYDVPGVDPDADPEEPKFQWRLHEENYLVSAETVIKYDTPFEVSDYYDTHKLWLFIRDTETSFEGLLLRPMILASDDPYTEWEPYREDVTVPVCQIRHSYDGGLRTTITVPEVELDDTAEVQQTGGGGDTNPYNETLRSSYVDSVEEVTA